MKKSKTKPAAKPKETSELPEWVENTPAIFYSLEMGHEGDFSLQTIDLNEQEYNALKNQLAVMRGYKVPAEADNA